jgi:hypothetical protein
MQKLNEYTIIKDNEIENQEVASVYDYYPGDPEQYPKGSPQEYPFPSQYFSNYSVGEIIAASNNKNYNDPLIATSGTLVCQEYQGKKMAFTDTHNFRLLYNGMNDNGVKVGWTDSISNVTFIPVASQPNKPTWAGMHLFARYRTSDDLYVASYRFDGQVTIKKKNGGKYTTLGQEFIGIPELGESYRLQFTCKGNSLGLYVNGSKKLAATDSSLTWGTSGIRMDYTDCYVENCRMTSPKVSDDEEGGIINSIYNYLFHKK